MVRREESRVFFHFRIAKKYGRHPNVYRANTTRYIVKRAPVPATRCIKRRQFGKYGRDDYPRFNIGVGTRTGVRRTDIYIYIWMIRRVIVHKMTAI